jgi:hypothetical protein
MFPTSVEWQASADKTSLAKLPFETLIVDEGHRLKRAESKLGTDLRGFRIPHTVLLTGTPLQNNVAELWSLLNFLAPKHFSSLETFERRFGEMKDAKQVRKEPIEYIISLTVRSFYHIILSLTVRSKWGLGTMYKVSGIGTMCQYLHVNTFMSTPSCWYFNVNASMLIAQ